MTGRGEPSDVTDLGNQDRSGDWADPVDALDGVIAGTVPEDVSDRRRELADLVIERLDELDDRFDALPER